MSFLILSPPRCMSAWLANLLTEGDTMCHHDALAIGGIRTLQELAAPGVGFAETAAMCVPAAMMELFPDAPMVLILADLQRVAESINRLGFDGAGFVRDYTPRVARATEMLRGRALFVRDTEVAERAGDIAEYLTGHRPSERRLALLRGLNITASMNPIRGNPDVVRALRELE